ncbi:MAG: 4-carboxymuconolactone decarboxylase [Cyanobacteria bacterium RYN_339]|nr:4-carboxymuconolactone decarboxylase [Cyanobacteria bacterium RYN_339]
MATPTHIAQFEQIFGAAGIGVLDSIKDLSPRLVDHVYSYIAGDLYQDETLDFRTRELCVIATLAAQGGLNEQVKVHVETALRGGVTRQEVVASIEAVGAYAGVPKALNAMFAAAEVFERLA